MAITEPPPPPSKNAWTPHESESLKQLVQQYGAPTKGSVSESDSESSEPVTEIDDDEQRTLQRRMIRDSIPVINVGGEEEESVTAATEELENRIVEDEDMLKSLDLEMSLSLPARESIKKSSLGKTMTTDAEEKKKEEEMVVPEKRPAVVEVDDLPDAGLDLEFPLALPRNRESLDDDHPVQDEPDQRDEEEPDRKEPDRKEEERLAREGEQEPDVRDQEPDGRDDEPENGEPDRREEEPEKDESGSFGDEELMGVMQEMMIMMQQMSRITKSFTSLMINLLETASSSHGRWEERVRGEDMVSFEAELVGLMPELYGMLKKMGGITARLSGWMVELAERHR